MITGVAIQRNTHYAFSSDPETDALQHLEQMAGEGFNAFGFRIVGGAILLLGESLRPVVVEASENEN
jgi:hypothetical protein